MFLLVFLCYVALSHSDVRAKRNRTEWLTSNARHVALSHSDVRAKRNRTEWLTIFVLCSVCNYKKYKLCKKRYKLRKKIFCTDYYDKIFNVLK